MPESRGAKSLNLRVGHVVPELGEHLQLEDELVEELQQLPLDPWAYWSLTVLSGGEAVYWPCQEEWGLYVPPQLQPRLNPFLARPATLRGKVVYDFSGGLLAQKTRELYANSDPKAQDRFSQLSRLGALLLCSYEDEMRRQGVMPQGPPLPFHQFPATILGMSGNPPRSGMSVAVPAGMASYPLDGPLQAAVTFGPGLTGARFTWQLVGVAERVYLVSGGMSAQFVSWYATVRNLGARAVATDGKIPQDLYHTAGIASSIEKIRAKQAGAPLDAAVMSRVHMAGADECIAGVRGSHELLREGGYFIVNAPQESRQNEAGLDVVLPEARTLFGDPIISGESAFSRPAGFAVFQKQ